MDQPTSDRPDPLRPQAPPADADAPRAEAAPAVAEQLTARAWLAQNGPFLGLLMLGLIWAYASFGMDAIISGLKVVVGLGFVIFIHELGHFLAAKWCDVHVLTFSIGFGPALPGCHFQRGETTYKIALLPLGGYVNMVGEGPEADEEEDYPRSFKNKSVGQRMLIISAGVIMNVLFGFLCFVIVYRYHGVERPPAVVWKTDSGSRAWEKGVESGWTVQQIGAKQDPWFDDLRVAVALSRGGQEVPFVFTDRAGKTHELGIEPLRDENNLYPVIGVRPPRQLQLATERFAKQRTAPVLYASAAALARALALQPGDRVVAAGVAGEGPRPLATKKGKDAPNEWLELAERMRQAGDKPMELRVLRKGAASPETVPFPAEGLAKGDRIIAVTDPATPNQPFRLTNLVGELAAFDYRKALAALAGKPIVLRVLRGDKAVDLFVPPAYHRTLGLVMEMGPIAAVREGSPALAAVERDKLIGMRISGVSVSYDNEPFRPLLAGRIDPVRLPQQLEDHITADPTRDLKKWRVQLRVRGRVQHDTGQETTLPPMGWDSRFAVGEEEPLDAASPMSLPQLGIAYRVESTIREVEPGSPAEKAGLKHGDQVQQVRFRKESKEADKPAWTPWIKMASRRGKEELFDQWAYYFLTLQETDYPEVEVKVQRAGAPVTVTRDGKESEAIGLEATLDRTWPQASRGLLLMPDLRRQQATSLVEALQFGLNRTWGFITQIYLNLSSLLSGRISAKSLGGPIEIASQAFGFAGLDFFDFALFLGIISINLAVVNFLPIPVLDGGHMVFLIYEWLRGKPPSEGVRVIATYIGLALILSLMVFVFYLDIKRRFWPPSWWPW